MFEKKVYFGRREALRSLLAAGSGTDRGIIFLPGNRDSPRNYRDNAYPFRQDSSFLYLFGLSARGLDAAIDLESGVSTLYGDDGSMDDVIWTGPVPSVTEMASLAGAERCAESRSLAADLAAARDSGRVLHFLPPYRESTRVRLAELAGIPLAKVRESSSTALVRSMVSLREIKDGLEIAELEKAVGISVGMHAAVLASARPGMSEARIAAIATQEALSGGGDLAFPVIATTRGEVLHNHDHSGILVEGGTFLMDAGAESVEGYAGDLTTTFPVGPRFTGRQADIYAVLSSVFADAASMLAPGVTMRQVHLAASTSLARGLCGLGIMRGDPSEAVECGAHALFFPHGLGHMIGLDVHDMEDYGEDFVGYDAGTGRAVGSVRASVAEAGQAAQARHGTLGGAGHLLHSRPHRLLARTQAPRIIHRLFPARRLDGCRRHAQRGRLADHRLGCPSPGSILRQEHRGHRGRTERAMKTVFASTFQEDAVVVKSLLESAGLQAEIFVDGMLDINPLFVMDMKGAQVRVPDDEEEDALSVVVDFRKNKDDNRSG